MCVLTMTKKRKKDVQEWLEQNPKAAKVYIGSTSSNLLSYILTPSSISLIAIDNEKPKTFTMEGTKQVFYLTPGKHTITSSFQKSRPGILSKRVITEYEPTTQEVEVEAEKTYIYSFDKKMNNILLQKKIKKVKNNLYSLLASL